VRLVALQRVVKLPLLHAAFLICHTAPQSETEKQTLRLCLARVLQKSPNDLPKGVDGATLHRIWRDVVYGLGIDEPLRMARTTLWRRSRRTPHPDDTTLLGWIKHLNMEHPYCGARRVRA